MRKAALFGLFAAICLALTAFIAAQIAHFSLEDRYQLIATFDDATGMLKGDAVRLAGVPVGIVKGVKVVDGRAEVRFAVNKDVALADDSVVVIRWVNLIGQRELYLAPGQSPSKLGEGDRVSRTRSVVDIGELVNKLGPLTQALNPGQVNEIVQSLVTALSGNLGNVSSIVTDLTTVLGTLAERKDTIGKLMEDYTTLTETVGRRDLQIQTVVENLVALSDTFAKSDKVLDDALVELPQLTTNLAAFLDRNGGHLGNIIDNFSLFTGVARQRIDDLEAILHNLPPSLSALFEATSKGNFVAVNVVCFANKKPPCPHPIILAAEAKGSGPLASPGAFRQVLVGR
jgi:phospholipid/cholesterol/gamma-HCH transport system substrate-binding protein